MLAPTFLLVSLTLGAQEPAAQPALPTRTVRVHIVAREADGPAVPGLPLALVSGEEDRAGMTKDNGDIDLEVRVPADPVRGREVVVLLGPGSFAENRNGAWPTEAAARTACEHYADMRERYAMPQQVVVPLIASQDQYEVAITAYPAVHLTLKAQSGRDLETNASDAKVKVVGNWGTDIADLRAGGPIMVRWNASATLIVLTKGPRLAVLDVPASATDEPNTQSGPELPSDPRTPVKLVMDEVPHDCGVKITLANRDAAVGPTDAFARHFILIARADGQYTFFAMIGPDGTMISEINPDTQETSPLNLSLPAGKYYVCPGLFGAPLPTKMFQAIRAGKTEPLDAHKVPTFTAVKDGAVSTTIDMAQGLDSVRAAVDWP